VLWFFSYVTMIHLKKIHEKCSIFIQMSAQIRINWKVLRKSLWETLDTCTKIHTPTKKNRKKVRSRSRSGSLVELEIQIGVDLGFAGQSQPAHHLFSPPGSTGGGAWPLGLVIRAFCIIIFASFRTSLYYYLHQSFIFHALLDDFRDFSIKSPPWYLTSRRLKISCFLYFDVSGTFWTSIWSGIFTVLIFNHKKQLERLQQTRGVTRPKRAAPSSYVCLHFEIKGMPYFPIIFWGGDGGGTLLPPPEGLICCSRQREIAAIDTTDSSLA
jgi:hypothetical protein